MLLNLNNEKKSQVPYEYFLMPDGQPHFRVENKAWRVSGIICSITSMNDIGKLAVAIDALCRIAGGMVAPWNLYIPYLLGARQDKVIEGEPLTIMVISQILNDIMEDRKPNQVYVLHPHSEAPVFCLNDCEEWDHTIYVGRAIEDYKPDFLIIPDLGAAKNAQKYDKFELPQVQCTKLRDPKTGKLSGFKKLEHDPLPGRKGLIIDDICDGGGTFLGIADLFTGANLALYTTHGLYTKGFSALNKIFDAIYCTNSYHYEPVRLDGSYKLTVFNLETP